MNLEIAGLGVTLGAQTLVDDFSLRLGPGQIHAVVGESGAGKTVSALAVLGLLPPGATVRGRAVLGDRALLAADERTRRAGLSMLFEEPRSALNPVLRIGDQLVETFAVHRASGNLRARAVDALAEVGVPSGEPWLQMFPHQLSGGQCQRVALACALAASPRVLIADEPTAGSDAGTRQALFRVLRQAARDREMGVWLITHDLHAVRAVSDEVSVMYGGRVIEHGRTGVVLDHPRHPYTQALLASNPARAVPGKPLPAIEGSAPGNGELISGCRFHPRCALKISRCRTERPEFIDSVACFVAK